MLTCIKSGLYSQEHSMSSSVFQAEVIEMERRKSKLGHKSDDRIVAGKSVVLSNHDQGATKEACARPGDDRSPWERAVDGDPIDEENN